MKLRTVLAALALGATALGAQASPALYFLIDGDTFSQPYSIRNDSTGGERITRFQLDLSTIAAGTFCFDTLSANNTVCNGNSNGGVPFSANGGTGALTGLIGTPVVPDGATLLDISFNHFDAAETFSWDIDVDQIGTVSQQTVTGNELIGATITVDFSDGQRLLGQLFAVAGNADASQFRATGITVTPVPITSTLALALAGLGLVGVAGRSRKA